MRRFCTFCTFFFALMVAQATAQPTPILEQVAARGQSCPAMVVAAGDILLVGSNTEASFTGIGDTLSTSFTQIDNNTTPAVRTADWIGTAASSGSDVITTTGSNTNNIIVCAHLRAGSITTTVDAHNIGSFTGTPATVTAGLTTNVGQDFLFYYVGGFRNNGAFSPVAPLQVVLPQDGFDSGAGGWLWTGANGSQSVSFSNSGNDQGSWVLAAFKTASPLAITSASLPTGALSTNFDAFVYAAGGVGSYTFTTTAGSLFGLTLNSSTGELTGTTTSSGTSLVTFKVTDSNSNTATQTIPFTVNATAATPAYLGTCKATNCSFTSVTSGNMIVVQEQAGILNPLNCNVPTDTLGTIFQEIVAATNLATGGNQLTQCLFAGLATASGADTVSSSSGSYYADLFSNLQLTRDIYGISNGSNSATSSGLLSASLTTPTANSIFYSAFLPSTRSTTVAVASPFTASSFGQSNGALGAFDLESTVGTFSASFSQTNNSNLVWDTVSSVFRPSTSGTVAASVRHRAEVY
jgi:hypothetical protein